MIIICCVDDNYGMMFNSRRQTQDKILREYVLEISKDSVLNMNSYSFNQFSTHNSSNIIVDENFLSNINNNFFYFVENESINNIEQKIKKIILFKWNRVYPADFYFNKSILNNFNLCYFHDFKGNSHEKITREDWLIK